MELEKWEEEAKSMVEIQVKRRTIKNSALLEAMAKLPRHLFVPEGFRNLAYADCALPLVKARPYRNLNRPR